MLAKNFSKSELISILEFIEATSDCRSALHLRRLILQAKEMICADYCVSALAKLNINGQTIISTVVNGNYPKEWLNIYMVENLHEKDPVVKHHMQFTTTQIWSDTFRRYNDKTTKLFLGRAADFGLRTGMSSGIFDPKAGNISIFSFGSNRRKFNNHNKSVLDTIILHLHKAITNIQKPSVPIDSLIM